MRVDQTTMEEATARPAASLSPDRRLALLREIREGGHILRAEASAEAQAAWSAKLAGWWELERLRDIRVRIFEGTTAAGDSLRAAIAVVTLSGMKYLDQHASEPYD